MGPNEAGKSTLCLTLNGLIPHLVRGALSGRVRTGGIDTQEHPVKDLFPHIGLVLQDFESQLFSTVVELEVAFAPENLGLAVSRNWVSRHGGTMLIESTEGKGTTVKVALPLRRSG